MKVILKLQKVPEFNTKIIMAKQVLENSFVVIFLTKEDHIHKITKKRVTPKKLIARRATIQVITNQTTL